MIALIPARGGSKRLTRKNLLEIGGLPLVANAIRAVRPFVDSIVVSTDDDTIAAVAEIHGAIASRTFKHTDSTTVDEVVAHYRHTLPGHDMLVYQPTVVIDPTVEYEVLQSFVNAVPSTANYVITWATPTGFTYPHDGAILTDTERKRAGLKEVGIRLYRADSRPDVWKAIGFTTPVVDIDTPADLLAARALVEKIHVHFIVAWGNTIGSGHLHRIAEIAGQLQHHRLTWSPSSNDCLSSALELNKLANKLMRFGTGWAPGSLLWVNADVFVRDALDSEPDDLVYSTGVPVIALEDRGRGGMAAERMFDPMGQADDQPYVVLRPEFSGLPKRRRNDADKSILITFGGTDPTKLTLKAIRALDWRAPLRVVLPPGASPEYRAEIEEAVEAASSKTVLVVDPVMVDELWRSRVVVCSAGRTVFEAAACGTPAVVMAQNPHEMRHRHAGVEKGSMRLGLGDKVDNHALVSFVKGVYTDVDTWEEMSEAGQRSVDGYGAQRVAAYIERVGQQHARERTGRK